MKLLKTGLSTLFILGLLFQLTMFSAVAAINYVESDWEFHKTSNKDACKFTNTPGGLKFEHTGSDDFHLAYNKYFTGAFTIKFTVSFRDKGNDIMYFTILKTVADGSEIQFFSRIQNSDINSTKISAQVRDSSKLNEWSKNYVDDMFTQETLGPTYKVSVSREKDSEVLNYVIKSASDDSIVFERAFTQKSLTNESFYDFKAEGYIGLTFRFGFDLAAYGHNANFSITGLELTADKINTPDKKTESSKTESSKTESSKTKNPTATTSANSVSTISTNNSEISTVSSAVNTFSTSSAAKTTTNSEASAASAVSGNESTPLLMIIISIIVILAAGGATTFIIIKKKKNTSPTE